MSYQPALFLQADQLLTGGGFSLPYMQSSTKIPWQLELNTPCCLAEQVAKLIGDTFFAKVLIYFDFKGSCR
jgi:hypothetical protein